MAARLSVGHGYYARRRYEIVVRGEVNPRFEAIFEGMTVQRHEDRTTISGGDSWP